jgi:putative ABC transport system permease protein
MKSIVLAWQYVRSRPLAAALNVLLLALGLASINFLLLVQHQVQQSFERDLQGIDVVVGAKPVYFISTYRRATFRWPM